MPTITKSAAAPADVENFSIGNVDFTLNAASPSFVTEDQTVIGNARANAWLDVAFDVSTDTDTEPTDPNDPFFNPEADHLSSQASPAAIDAANTNQAAISEVVTGEQSVAAGGATTAESVGSLFDAVGLKTEPILPVPPVTDTATPATPVATVTQAAPTTSSASSSSSSEAATPSTTGSAS
jgi:hypothetical protein